MPERNGPPPQYERKIKLKDGSEAFDVRLGCIFEWDERNEGYLLDARAIEQEVGTSTPRTQIWNLAPGLDQGSLGACVGFSLTHRLNAAPVEREPDLTRDDAIELYFAAQQRDQWPGGEYPGADPVMSGTSVLAGCQELHARGTLSGYRWISNTASNLRDDILLTLSHVGGLNIGVNWYRSMYTVQSNGVMVVDTRTQYMGGHALHVCGLLYRVKLVPGKARDYVVIQNSWGNDFGIAAHGQPGGIAYIDVDDFVALLRIRGDVAVLTEVEPAAPVEPTEPPPTA